MKKTLLGLLLSTSVLAVGAVSVSADINTGGDQVVNGTGSGMIPIQGQLGVDNTDPTKPGTIPEGDPAWINVSLPMTTTFYNSKGSTNISSPTYYIQNNSGRPVKVSYAGLTGDTTSGLTLNAAFKTVGDGAVLSPNLTGGIQNLITNGASNTTTGGEIATLEGVTRDQGQTASNKDGGEISYTYTGTYTGNANTITSYNFLLTFEALTTNDNGEIVPVTGQ